MYKKIGIFYAQFEAHTQNNTNTEKKIKRAGWQDTLSSSVFRELKQIKFQYYIIEFKIVCTIETVIGFRSRIYCVHRYIVGKWSHHSIIAYEQGKPTFDTT